MEENSQAQCQQPETSSDLARDNQYRHPLSVYRLPFTASHISWKAMCSRTVHGSRSTVNGQRQNESPKVKHNASSQQPAAILRMTKKAK